MKLTIVVPSFNQGKYLGRTLDSIFQQSLPPFQVVVADGASTDESVEVLKEYSKRYPQLEWLSEPDKGPADAVNKGLARVKGDWVGIFSSDDLYYPGAFETVKRTAQANPGSEFLYGDITVFDGQDQYLGESKLPEFSWEAFFGLAACIPQGSVFFSARLAREVGGWNPSYYGCDLDYWLRMVFRTRALKVPALLSGWRVYPEQRTRPDRYQKIWNDYWRMIEESPDIQAAPAKVQRLARASGHVLALSYHPTGKLWAVRGHALAAFAGHPTWWRYQERGRWLRLFPGYETARTLYRKAFPRPPQTPSNITSQAGS